MAHVVLRSGASMLLASALASPFVSAQTHDLSEFSDRAVDSEGRGRPGPQMERVLDVYQLIAGTPIIDLSPQDARQQFSAEDAAKAIARGTGNEKASEPVGKVTDGLVIPGPGGPLPIRIYTPKGTGPFPVIVYYHGGGFVIATIDTYDASARALANLSKAIVVSVEYRKAPEHPFPAALHDAVAAYQWVRAHAATFDGDSGKVAVAGESAGGNLAAEVCLEARENGFEMPVYQLLIYPVTDLAKTDYPSEKVYANAIPLSTPALLYFGKYYLTNPAEATNVDVSPIRANLKGLAPATIIGAQIDPLQDQGRAYAQKLKAAGVPVKYKLYEGVTHEFFGMGAVVEQALDAEELAGTELRAAFSKQAIA